MKIKVPPYPNFTISETTFQRDVVSNSTIGYGSDTFTNQMILITEFESGEKRVLRTRPVKYQNKIFLTAFPNPVHLFLSTSIDHYNHSESIKKINFSKCGQTYGDDIYILDFDENGTHSCYNDYIKYRLSSIIMLVSALEAFLNQVVDNDFIYKAVRKNKIEEFNKKDIESAKVSFKEKLEIVIPQWLNKLDFWDEYEIEKKILTKLYENRKNIIHLKTNSDNDFNVYFNTIDQMLDFELFDSIEASIKFMNLVKSKFIEIEKK